MCGIAGALERAGRPADEAAAARMARAIAHRGPDDEGVLAEGPVALANRRLAIVDPSPAGHMPMTSADGRWLITYNGEVYNFRELRSELERGGRSLRTGTDTEVVLEAIAAWGPAAVERFNGMFALAMWDRERRELLLARDRCGVKPLYYAQSGGTFVFGSEIKALLAHGAVRARVSPEHLLEYFTFQNLFTDGTLFAGVRLLPAGHTLRVGCDNAPTAAERYWDFDFREPAAPVADAEYEEELERLFRQAVHRQLVADVPVGAHLSGGMDSGSVTAVAAAALPWLPTFTVGFDMRSASGLELGSDERAKAEDLSYRFGTEHFEAVLKAGDMERAMPALTWHLEDLRVGQSYPNFSLARLASRFCKVVLTGTGGDELFAGYPWRYYRAVVNNGVADYTEKYYRSWHRLIPCEAMDALLAPHIRADVRDVRTIDLFRSALPTGAPPERPEDFVNCSLHLEARTFLHGLLLVEDKLSMAYGLESRVPFLDNDLVDFAQQLPVRLKLRDLASVVALNENEPGDKTERYFRRTRDGKLLLRKVLARHVPPAIADQVKQGFSGPDATWFRGDSIDYVRRTLLDDGAALYDYLDPRGVRPLVLDHLEGRENRRLLLWSLISFEHWCRAFL